jgi:hypothetical protein
MTLRIWGAAPLLLLTTGCAVKTPATWRLAGPVLTPPGVAGTVGQRTFTVPRDASRGECPQGEAVTLQGRKGNLKVTVNRAALEKQPKGWLADWTARAESGRCVAAGGGPALAARVVESLPLGVGTSFRLMRSDDVRAGYVDLGPENRMEVISPILREGAAEDAPLIEESGVAGTDRAIEVTLKASPDLIGHETAWYSFQPKAGGGTRIAALSAESRVRGVVVAQTAPAKNYFAFGPEIGFYRLFYKADQTEVLVGATSREKLPLDLDGCGKPGGPTCVNLPKRVGVNPYLTAMVNDKVLPLPIHLPASLRTVIQTAKAKPEAVLPTLTIRKPFAGKMAPVEFDRTRQDVLNLVLTGNEEIRW